MKKLLCFTVHLFFIAILNTSAQTTVAHKVIRAPFQGIREFCSFYQKSKYIVSIKDDSAVITCIYKGDSSKVNGKIRNGKLYTDDVQEKSDKKLAGKYYLLTKDMIRILNTENG